VESRVRLQEPDNKRNGGGSLDVTSNSFSIRRPFSRSRSASAQNHSNGSGDGNGSRKNSKDSGASNKVKKKSKLCNIL
jgi:hypothetical protein